MTNRLVSNDKCSGVQPVGIDNRGLIIAKCIILAFEKNVFEVCGGLELKIKQFISSIKNLTKDPFVILNRSYFWLMQIAL